MQEFFLQVKPSARIFFSDKYCFVCGILIKKNYFTKDQIEERSSQLLRNLNCCTLLVLIIIKDHFFNNYIKEILTMFKIKCHVLFVIF